MCKNSKLPGRFSRFFTFLVITTVFTMLFFIAAGCSEPEKKSSNTEPEWAQTLIYFGRNIPGGGTVSEEQFDKFLQDVVTKEFPKGLTVFDSYGQMQKDDGSIEIQSTKVVLLVHEKTKSNSEAVSSIIDSFRSTFGTPQVMRTTIPIEVEFFQSAETSEKPTREQVEAFVNEAVEYARENGKEKALAEFTDQNGSFKRGELYIYAYDFNGTVLAHGGDPALVGENLIDYTDPNGVKVIQELIKIAQSGGGWLDYTWDNPETNEQEPKHGYVLKVDDNWFLGSGTYD